MEDIVKRVCWVIAGIAILYGAWWNMQLRDESLRELGAREMRAQATVIKRVERMGTTPEGYTDTDGNPVSCELYVTFRDAKNITRHADGLPAPCDTGSVVEVAYSKDFPTGAIVVWENRYPRWHTIGIFLFGATFVFIGIFGNVRIFGSVNKTFD
ncbi:hypothetical protein FACS189441_3820 [Betaproteobacteria bacterium]|nr:hypothetical protein FACS189441_3820 [Betaproteobacteria bacterium]